MQIKATKRGNRSTLPISSLAAPVIALLAMSGQGSWPPEALAQSSPIKSELVTKMPAGIPSLSLAPQHDMLAAVTYKGTVLLGSKQWSSQFERVLFCNQDTLLLSTYSGQLVVCNALEGTPRFSIAIQEPRTDLAKLPVAAQGDLLAYSYFAPNITLWNTRTARQQTTLRLTWRDFLQPEDTVLRQDALKSKGAKAAGPSGYQASMNTLAFSPTGKMLAAGMVINPRQGARYGKVGVWDLPSKRLKHLLRTNSEVMATAFSPREEALACITASGNVLLWKWPLSPGNKPALATAVP